MFVVYTYCQFIGKGIMSYFIVKFQFSLDSLYLTVNFLKIIDPMFLCLKLCIFLYLPIVILCPYIEVAKTLSYLVIILIESFNQLQSRIVFPIVQQ